MNNTRHKLGRAMTFALMTIMLVAVARTQTNKQINQAQLRSLQQEDYAKRELSAPPAARQKLTELRQRIKARNLGFEVGYTAPMERGARSITGGGLPPNILAIAKKQNIIARQVKQLDRQTRDQALKENPQLKSRLPEMSTSCFANEPSFDWRRSGKVTGIRTQGCGSCWAYGAMAVLESSYLIRNNLTIDGSEQFIVSNSGAGSCEKGGGTKAALDFLANTGTTTDADLPDSGNDGTPDVTDFSTPYRALVYGFVSDTKVIPDVSEIKAALCEHGPVVSWVGVTDSFISYIGPSSYKDDDYAAEKASNKPCPSTGGPNGAVCGHYVTIIGWNDAKNAWLIKNSWGTNFGSTAGFGTERGYMWIDYGTNQIGSGAMWADAINNAYRMPPSYYQLMPQARHLAPGPLKTRAMPAKVIQAQHQ
jgi:C1A family cysteine protease